MFVEHPNGIIIGGSSTYFILMAERELISRPENEARIRGLDVQPSSHPSPIAEVIVA